MTMVRAVVLRGRVLRLRRLGSWRARRLADMIEARLLARMSWAR